MRPDKRGGPRKTGRRSRLVQQFAFNNSPRGGATAASSTLSNFSEMGAMTFAMFTSAPTGFVVAMAWIRAFTVRNGGSDLGKDGECGSAEVRGLHPPPDEGGARPLGRAFGVLGHHHRAGLVAPARTASTTSMIASVTSLGCSLWISWPLFVFVTCLAPGTSAAKRSWAFFCAASVM